MAKTILLVDDEDFVRNATRELLQFYGYQVFDAGDAEAALKLADSINYEMDVLITDIVMPGINGKQLAERLLVKRPTLPIIFISGYTDGIISGTSLDARTSFIQKPFSLTTLTSHLRKVLEPVQ